MVTRELRELFKGEPWHGPSLETVLRGVTAQQAARRPIPGAHSIWELVLHLEAWHRVVIRRLAGERVDEPEEGDFPVPSGDPADWDGVLTRFRETFASLISAIEQLDDTALERLVPGNNYTARHMVAGTVNHLVYHTGQIGLLRKAF